jgi:hypothetical protein
MFDTLLLRPSLHCNTPLHFTTLHPITLHYTYRRVTSCHLHFTTLSFSFTNLHFLSFYTLHAKKNQINLLNAELNPICHLLVLLGDLTFMGPCIVSIFQHTCISNKIQRCTVYLYLETALHISGGTSTHHLATVSTASGICHTVTAICCYRGRVGTGLSVL